MPTPDYLKFCASPQHQPRYTNATIVPATGIAQLTFDARRNRLYGLRIPEFDGSPSGVPPRVVAVGEGGFAGAVVMEGGEDSRPY